MEIRGHRLILGGILASELVREFGSPLYVYEEETLRRQCRLLREAFPYRPYRPLYSCKANESPRILKRILEEGIDLEVVSPGELALGLGVGAPPARMHYTANGVTREEMAFAAGHGVAVTMDAVSQMVAFAGIAPKGSAWIRLNPGVGAGHQAHVVTGGPLSKFGIPVERAGQALSEARRLGIRLAGLHMHIGSNFMDPGPFLESVEVLLKAAERFPDLSSVCLGGGFGIAYRPSERSLDLSSFGRALSERFGAFAKGLGREITLAVEPGRFLVCEAGFLLTRVATVKEGTERTFAITDTGFNHLIRPALYGAYHAILKADAADLPGEGKVDVCGNLCETTDIFRRDTQLPQVAEGDVLAFTHAGAYGFAMASTYNLRPLPAEVMVSGGKAELIRRRESPEELAARHLNG